MGVKFGLIRVTVQRVSGDHLLVHGLVLHGQDSGGDDARNNDRNAHPDRKERPANTTGNTVIISGRHKANLLLTGRGQTDHLVSVGSCCRCWIEVRHAGAQLTDYRVPWFCCFLFFENQYCGGFAAALALKTDKTPTMASHVHFNSRRSHPLLD